MNNQDLRTSIFFFFILLTFYCYGAGMVDYFGVYEPWKLIDAEDFAAYHQFQGERIVRIFVLPSAVMTIFNILSLIFPPAYIARKWLWLSLILYAFDWIFSFTMQIPIQLILETKKDTALIEELLRTNWYRFAADTLQFLVVCWMVIMIFRKMQFLNLSRA